MKNILCVILHFGNVTDTINCIKSVIVNSFVEIVVCDNDPLQNFEIDNLLYPDVKIYHSGGKMGFSEANNVTINTYLDTNHELILLLNNDIIVLNNAIEILMKSLENSSVGLVGPCMYYSASQDQIWACGGWINTINLKIGGYNKLKSDKPFEVDYLPGAALMLRKNTWIKSKGLPEKYFLAYEEAEFALNIKKMGFKVLAIPNSKFVHLVGMSNQVKPMYIYNSNRNRLLFGKYLFGDTFGRLIGTINILIDAFKTFNIFKLFMNLKILTLSVKHELLDIPINKEQLTFVKNKFKYIK